jgi:hypothetical protein
MIIVYMETRNHHLEQFFKCLKECRLNGISLNPLKCAFCVNLGVLFGHNMCHDGLLVDPRKITIIIVMLVPTNLTKIK